MGRSFESLGCVNVSAVNSQGTVTPMGQGGGGDLSEPYLPFTSSIPFIRGGTNNFDNVKCQ